MIHLTRDVRHIPVGCGAGIGQEDRGCALLGLVIATGSLYQIH